MGSLDSYSSDFNAADIEMAIIIKEYDVQYSSTSY
jgi:hypothetical protein